jgi:hypothetical protein
MRCSHLNANVNIPIIATNTTPPSAEKKGVKYGLLRMKSPAINVPTALAIIFTAVRERARETQIRK